ncbi:MAG: pilus assembly protein PilB [Phycisphaerae bacterium]|nr:pilus assembly protein PilB [Phycisphaerae bacterium]MBM91474.1 pilus assembly protein PilB [Phycisphaerae bacterium]MBM92657.1 pilus assembly protein PilB [Phycisphaerae bacterium]HCT44105.1 pilus assembly protein PilB [Phycisphaerales bacterium]|tara:strand:- start:511 stop:2253 length:1743 start_codon:yes stop_codon:yes gene_type:complete
MARSRKKLGQILVAQGAINAEQADQGIKHAQQTGKRVGEALIDLGVIDEMQVVKALAAQYGMKYVDLSNEKIRKLIDDSALDKSVMKKNLVIPLGKSGGKMRMAIHDPMDLEMLDNLRFRLNMDIEPMLATKSQIKGYLEGEAAGGGIAAGGSLTEPAQPTDQQASLVTDSIDRSIDRSLDRSMDRSIDVSSEDSPVVKLVNRILDEAVRNRTSDIHIEPMEDRVRLRYRIDGVCAERDNLPKRMQNAVLSRLKLMAGMNIAEKRVPQDGRIKIHVDDVGIDFRVSACPAYHGESVVLRILRPDAVRIGLENLGFESENLETFNKIIRRPNGIFLVTGPTGSGKTTTLYSALDVLNRPDKKIITAEDPVEYNFEGINQCQVREGIGLTFPAILRSMLRQAPNVILVGEIRDKEVGEIAIQAALTGHLVFSTLHTNDAPSAMTRLIDMGIKPFLVASSIQAVMAQRLIRVLHDSKQIASEDELDHKYLNLIRLKVEDAIGKVYKAVPCDEAPSGYKGRKAVFEMMIMNAEIRDLAFKRAPSSRIRKAAIAAGMKELVEDGRLKVLNGTTTPEEIARVSQAD